MKVLVAVDGSASSLRAVEYVTKHADVFGVTPDITLVTVHLPIPSPRAKAWVGKDVVDEYYADESAAALADALALLKSVGRSAKVVTLVGEPGHEVAVTAKDGYQMVVMGTHGRTALGNLVMGSVANRTVAESPVPVLLVK